MSPVLSFFRPPVVLPSMPEVARRLLNTFGRDNVSIDELATVIGTDGALSARLLRLANSPRYAPSRPIMRLNDAAQIIGLGALRGLALGASLADCFPHPPGFDRLRFWRQNLATAGHARWLAQAAHVDADTAETAGLMLRSGQLLMLMHEPGLLSLVEALTGPPDSVFELERLHFGCTHAEVSAELAVRWRFPSALVDALHSAGDPLAVRPFQRMGAVLRLASVLADAGDSGLDPVASVDLAQPELSLALGLDLANMPDLCPHHARLTLAVDAFVS
ncbi:HDOD domain-containing protein [Aquabacterium sp. OR-4]|uniref:HDOD domain-containing protein n=1 Tax=Aquabacterium sp. OR-4 TaxID=2978127 RepID=UPI0021B1D3F2|nr:HDOD domain-containing protein [Aquabacterium sp. OR-4]MDT7836589.1 HDOD domain-containing protein [Aquabacterium sp. OR-4]